ncbi:MAG: hypothetical protein ACE5F5_11440, partial [Acidimicrobiia bacterium]
FHDDRTGGYLIWAAWPERKVFIDDRAELYRNRMAEFVAVRKDKADWAPLFAREGIDEVLLGTEEPLVGNLIAEGWTVTYRDDFFVVLRR